MKIFWCWETEDNSPNCKVTIYPACALHKCHSTKNTSITTYPSLISDKLYSYKKPLISYWCYSETVRGRKGWSTVYKAGLRWWRCSGSRNAATSRTKPDWCESMRTGRRLVQDCRNSRVLAMELLQAACTKLPRCISQITRHLPDEYSVHVWCQYVMRNITDKHSLKACFPAIDYKTSHGWHWSIMYAQR